MPADTRTDTILLFRRCSQGSARGGGVGGCRPALPAGRLLTKSAGSRLSGDVLWVAVKRRGNAVSSHQLSQQLLTQMLHVGDMPVEIGLQAAGVVIVPEPSREKAVF